MKYSERAQAAREVGRAPMAAATFAWTGAESELARHSETIESFDERGGNEGDAWVFAEQNESLDS